jgi:hypothetical protein
MMWPPRWPSGTVKKVRGHFLVSHSWYHGLPSIIPVFQELDWQIMPVFRVD